MGTLEIEIRYQLGESQWKSLAASLLRIGFRSVGTTKQTDLYYTSKAKDFIASEECLRLRQEAQRSTLTWKPPSTGEMRAALEFWKEEVDLQVTGQEAVVRRLLEVLDFVEYVTVRKERREYVRGNVEVALDAVDGAGHFIELEVKSSELQRTRSLLASVSAELGLTSATVCTVPYRDLVPRTVNG